MRDWIIRHRFGVTVAVLLVGPLLLMYYHGRRSAGTSFMERFSMTVAGSAQAGVSWVVEGVAGLVGEYLYLVGVEDENERLREERERLLSEALLAKKLAAENQELRKLLNFKGKKENLKLAPGRVISRELSPFYRVTRLIVDLDGGAPPAVDMAVLTHSGLVGRVVHAAGRYADVMLVPDSRSRVACEVLGRGVLGTLIGNGTLDEYQARFQMSAAESPLEAGAVIVTSGHDRVFPRGIEVGYVSDPSSRRPVGQFVEYDVMLAVNPATVDEALVVVGMGER